ncbi:hypothetical protein ACJMK2_015495 [Sinanodonta woodiana]|uniref:Uncharacterized protein n=1 Tax=Sinanodonta woodiana TaxID=1069815 RepID=A0ABD3US07_SINWO
MTCEYTRDYGYTKNDVISEMKCQINGSWESVNIDDLCEVSSAQPNDAPAAAIGVGVTIAVIIFIVITLIILRRRSLNSTIAPKILKDEIMSGPDLLVNRSFCPDAGTLDTYEKGAVNITGLKTQDGRTEVSVSFENTGRENSLKYDNAMAIPRPDAKLNL